MAPIRFDAAVLRAARTPLAIERVEARALGPDDVLRLVVLRDGAPRETVLRARPLTDERIEDRAWRALGIRVRPRRGGGIEIECVVPFSSVSRR